MEILVVSGGHVDPEFAAGYIAGRSFERIIAADRGLYWCRQLKLEPTEILGDFDSLPDKYLLEEYTKKGVPVRTFPERKDYTDTHLALMAAADYQPSEILVLGATGTRYDHALANIALLQWMAERDIFCTIADKYNEIEMLKGPKTRAYKKCERLPFFSLIAWGGRAEGIDLEGFSYPLKDGSLSTDISLGISNEIVAGKGTVTVRSGYLLVIRSSDI